MSSLPSTIKCVYCGSQLVTRQFRDAKVLAWPAPSVAARLTR